MKYLFDTHRLIDICQQNDVNFVGIFGSMARGDATDQSDIDLLVKFAGRKSFLALVRLERELTTAMGRKVDVLTEASLNPHLRDDILHDLQVIYEA
jgi:predicted nucleotidyltransferase